MRIMQFMFPVLMGILGVMIGAALMIWFFNEDVDLKDLVLIKNSRQTLISPIVISGGQVGYACSGSPGGCTPICRSCISLPSGTPIKLKFANGRVAVYSVDFTVAKPDAILTAPVTGRPTYLGRDAGIRKTDLSPDFEIVPP